MTHREALEVLSRHRQDAVVVTTMSSVGVWPEFSDTPLDFHYLPSSMGQGVSFGLGLALAQPSRRVIVLTGDGSLLMNLGSLVTATQHDLPFTVILIDNGLYEVTGGQPFVGAGRVDFRHLAYAAGFQLADIFADQDKWEKEADYHLTQPVPTFVWLEIDGEKGKKTPVAPRLMSEQIARLRGALGVI